MNSDSKDAVADAINVAIVCLVVGLSIVLAGMCTGCSSWVQPAARGGTVLTVVHMSAGEQIDAARDRALDAVEAEHPVPEPGPDLDPSRAMAVVARNNALDAEAARWHPLGLALDTMRSVLQSYAQSVSLAHAAGGGGELLPEIARTLGRLVNLYATVQQAAAELGIDDLPELPAEVRQLARALGGDE